MNLHEYQGKEILASFGVRVQRGIVAHNAHEAVEAAKQLTQETGTSWHVIKAQVHAGGRGKGGGVKLAKNLKEVESLAGQIIGMNLITPQTSAEGKKVHQVCIGSCTNSRIEDLRQAAAILKGRKKAEHVQLLVVPGSHAVRVQAEAEGLDKIFKAAGAEWSGYCRP